MPTYEYACTSCGHHTEAVQSFSDDPLTTCPECGGPLRKVYGAVGIVLKGSGFYKTDSRAASGSKSGNGLSDKSDKSDKAADSSTSSSGSGSSGDNSSGTPKGGSGGTDGAKPSGSKSSEGAKAAAST